LNQTWPSICIASEIHFATATNLGVEAPVCIFRPSMAGTTSRCLSDKHTPAIVAHRCGAEWDGKKRKLNLSPGKRCNYSMLFYCTITASTTATTEFQKPLGCLRNKFTRRHIFPDGLGYWSFTAELGGT
jgi:hypothetical protein